MNGIIATLCSIICCIGTYGCIVAAAIVYGYKCAALMGLALLLAGIARGIVG